MNIPDQSIVIPGLAKRFLTQALRLDDEATLGDLLAEIDRLQHAAISGRKLKRPTREQFPAWAEDQIDTDTVRVGD